MPAAPDYPASRAPQPMLSTPLRAKAPVPMPEGFKNFFSAFAARFPNLKKQLFVAEMPVSPVDFVQQCFISAIIVMLILEVVTVFALANYSADTLTNVGVSILAIPVFFFLSFYTMLYEPRVRMQRRGRKIDQELVFAGRHLLIELRSGVVLFDAMLGVSQDYGEVSREFNKIVEKITLGVPASVAMHDVADNCPSAYYRRVILQMANSLSSGSDVAQSLEVVLNQISQEQIIQLKAYGQKLNPLVMFYMLFGVIIPSLGVAFLIILLSFIGSGLAAYGVGLLAGILVLVAIIQFMFLSIVENSRPSFDLT
jgi:flagellar protein FlaJ